MTPLSNSKDEKNKEGSNDNKVTSPCVRNCCLNEQDICLGCFRHLDEITGWMAMTEQEQLATLALCKRRKNKAQ